MCNINPYNFAIDHENAFIETHFLVFVVVCFGGVNVEGFIASLSRILTTYIVTIWLPSHLKNNGSLGILL